MYGLICEARQNEERIEVSLDRIEAERGPNCQLVRDYAYWFVNY